MYRHLLLLVAVIALPCVSPRSTRLQAQERDEVASIALLDFASDRPIAHTSRI